MCDTLVIVTPKRVLFAKNSDRDPNEAQTLDWQHAGTYSTGTKVRCTYLEIPQVETTAAVLLSRPFWMWGAEMGVNEHGVCIGNEAVFTNQPHALCGLTGMDLVRLGLERGKTAANTLDILINLLETYGQGGGCGLERRSFTYHNSFIIADPQDAYVLETAGRHWAKERVAGVRSISNGLTIPGFAEKYRNQLRSQIANCRIRQARTSQLGNDIKHIGQLFNLLRDHGTGGLRYSWLNGSLHGPCAHAGGLVAATQTTASWISQLSTQQNLHWATATSTPCLSIFKPVAINQPVDLGPWPSQHYDACHYWWRHERRVRKGLSASQEWINQRNELESQLAHDHSLSARAFSRAESWIDSHQPQLVEDCRPWYVRRYWKQRNDQASLPL